MGSFLQVVVRGTDMKAVVLLVIFAMHPLNGSVYYRVSDPSTIVVVGLHYTQPGPDAFFWAGERRVNGGCNNDNIAEDSYSLAPGEIGTNDYYDIAKPIL